MHTKVIESVIVRGMLDGGRIARHRAAPSNMRWETQRFAGVECRGRHERVGSVLRESGSPFVLLVRDVLGFAGGRATRWVGKPSVRHGGEKRTPQPWPPELSKVLCLVVEKIGGRRLDVRRLTGATMRPFDPWRGDYLTDSRR